MVLFSIIIPTSNRPEKLKLLFESVIRNGFDPSIYELIVVENGEEKLCSELCNAFIPILPIKYYYKIVEGFSAAEARNVGISKAKGKYILLFDDDVILEPNCIRKHLFHHLKNDKPKLVFGFRNNILNDEKINPTLEKIEEDYRLNLKIETTEKNRLWYYAYSCNLSINASKGKEYFDSNFKTWGNEDQEFAYRLFKKQYEIIVGNDCFVYHYCDSKIRNPFLRDKYGLNSDYKDFLLSRLYFLKKHWKDVALRNFIIEDLKLYEFRKERWTRNKTPKANFNLSELAEALDFNF